jgi:hypothetical protein
MKGKTVKKKACIKLVTISSGIQRTMNVGESIIDHRGLNGERELDYLVGIAVACPCG